MDRKKRDTLQETNISPKNGILKMIFLFPRWDMLISWRVSRNCVFSKIFFRHFQLEKWGSFCSWIWTDAIFSFKWVEKNHQLEWNKPWKKQDYSMEAEICVGKEKDMQHTPVYQTGDQCKMVRVAFPTFSPFLFLSCIQNTSDSPKAGRGWWNIARLWLFDFGYFSW